MFRPLFEQRENCQARFAEPEKSAAARSTGADPAPNPRVTPDRAHWVARAAAGLAKRLWFNDFGVYRGYRHGAEKT